MVFIVCYVMKINFRFMLKILSLNKNTIFYDYYYYYLNNSIQLRFVRCKMLFKFKLHFDLNKFKYFLKNKSPQMSLFYKFCNFMCLMKYESFEYMGMKMGIKLFLKINNYLRPLIFKFLERVKISRLTCSDPLLFEF